MRVISQKGMPVIIDLPYERIAVSQSYKEPNDIIGFDLKAKDDDVFYLATYSTPEKAEKAMQKLHECCLGIQVTHMTEFDGDDSFLNSIGIYKISENGEYAHKLTNRERIFRFPAEDEI